MTKDALLYVGQKAFIKKGDEVLILNDPNEGLDFPGGKIQEGEKSLEKSLQREVFEETGLEINILNPFTTWTSVFPPKHNKADQRIILIGYHCEYVSGEVKISHEHDNFKWVNKNNYTELDDGTFYFEILKKYFNSFGEN